MEKRVCSKRTLRLFIAFGAASMALIAIVYGESTEASAAHSATAKTVQVNRTAK